MNGHGRAADDPFDSPFDGGRTFVRPNPGGRMPGGRTTLPPPASTAASGDDAPPDHGLNSLLALANRLLLLLPQLRQTRHVADPMALRASLAQGVRDFVAAAQQRGIATERVNAARYVLCTVIDEAVAATPWGGGGVWSRHSLLAEFHNETAGGEKVFQLMARLAEKPAEHLDLLELIHAALVLGFEGRYATVEHGRMQLEAIRARLAQIVRRERGDYPAALAQHWAPAAAARRRPLGWLPLAAAAALAVVALGATWTALAVSLADRAAPVQARLQRLRLPPPVAVVAQPAPEPRLAGLLEPDVRAGLVAVRDELDRSVVTIRGDGMFAAASAEPRPERAELVRRIAEAFVRVGGDVLVTGHTDSSPIRSARFPSNWHLSQERARSVAALLAAAGVPAARIRAEGRADGEPLLGVRDDTDAGRAQNRRVELTLLTGRAQAAAAASAAAPAPTASR